MLDALAGEPLVGLHTIAQDLRSVRFRPGRSTGAGPERARRLWLGRGLSDPRVERTLRAVLASGEPAYDVVCHLDGGGGETGVTFGLSVVPLRDAGGEPAGLAVAVTDRTFQEQARRRLLLDRARAGLGNHLDVFRAAQALAETAVPALADAVTVDVLDSVTLGETPLPGPLTDPATVRRAGFAYANGTRVRLPHEVGSVRLLHPGTPFSYALADLRPHVVPGIPDDAVWLSQDPARAEVFRQAGVHAMVVVPLLARGTVLGVAGFYRASTPEPFSAEDTVLAAELAAHGALHLDNARLHTRERTVAKIAQRQMLPVRLPSSVALDVAHAYLPAAAGGCWYDVIRLSGARVALVAGEVHGTGLRAATAMGQLRTAVHAFADLDLDPAELLSRLDELAARLALEHLGPDFPATTAGELTAGPLSASCLYAVYDAVHGHCEVASAAHPPPLLTVPGSAPQALEVVEGPALGGGAGPYRAVRRRLPEGSLLALYSQGLLAGGSSGQDLLARLLAEQGAHPLDVACDNMLSGLLPQNVTEDSLLLLARTRILTPHQKVSVHELPDDPRSAKDARRAVAEVTARWGLEELAPTVELIVSELVTNAVRYAHGTITLRFIRAETLICEVSDSNTAAPHLRIAKETDEGGRGLYMVGLMARSWGARQTTDGKTIWADLTLPDRH
ncbi:SpoIIE family protein phosphatase [Streptomyces sp. NPDC002640]